MAEVISVTALNRYVKALLDGSDLLYDLALRGEVANFVRNAKSGHCYFTLRDSQSSVKAVMFRAEAQRLAFRPQEGMRVVVRCRATLYERDGAFQVYVNAMFPDGVGEAQLALEQLKAKLEAEGLFAPEHKKPLPAYPQKIGLVTSRTGAALQDIRNVVGRRWPAARLILCPVTVQGFEAAGEVAAAIARLDRLGVDEIIVARGGGSREDLWVFNAEVIARAAYRCKTPLISAIGHEIDYTILEEAADSCKEDYYVRINYLNEIPTWSIIPYTSSIEDSNGNDPVQIINTQIANGFITIEFYYETSALSDTHNFSLVMHPATSSSNNIQLEFRHNAHGDKGTNKFGHVCFRLQEALLDKQGLIKLRIKYNDFNGPKDIDLTYNSPQMGDTNFTPQSHFSR